MTRIEKKLEKARLKLKALLLEKEEKKRLKVLQARVRKKRGRKPLDEKIIDQAKEMTKTKFLPDVALSLGISLRTLYNYGIKRKILNEEINKFSIDT